MHLPALYAYPRGITEVRSSGTMGLSWHAISDTLVLLGNIDTCQAKIILICKLSHLFQIVNTCCLVRRLAGGVLLLCLRNRSNFDNV